MLIQIILLIIIAVIVLRLAVKYRAKELPGKQFISWLVFWLAASAAVIWPQLTVNIANRVGVGRGSDLVVYLALIFLFYILFRLFLRIEKLEKNLTKVARAEALKEKNDSTE
ncbi:MAG: DUF2304 domain-containing protein [Candidatus Buchananbacteria bacterium]